MAAQVVPDATLPVNSIVTPDGETLIIEGGTAAGSSLFHSFDRFDIPTGFEAHFNNAAIVENIFSRVTGGSISDIDGLIRANGTANLFLMNPNGIIFGPNAQLDIGGSFFATTAESLVFEGDRAFSATEPNASPLLTVNVPVGLQFGDSPGAIVNRSVAPSVVSHPTDSPVPLPSSVGLEVRPGHNITLLGGDIHLEGGHLSSLFETSEELRTEHPTIELGSIASPDIVSLTPTATGFAVGYEGVRDFGDIELSGEATVNADGLGGGAIRARGDRLFLRDNASIRADTWGDLDGRGIDLRGNHFIARDRAFVSASTFAGGRGGGIDLYAAESVDLTGASFAEFQTLFVVNSFLGTLTPFDRTTGLFSVAGGSGNGGEITIETGRLTLEEGAVVLTPTFDRARGGNISVAASESIEVIGSILITGTSVGSVGAAGDIDIETNRAIVRDGGSIQAFTQGEGSGGDIVLNASESVELLRDRIDSQAITGIATTTLGEGVAGNITVETQKLVLEDGAEILTTSGLLFPGIGQTDTRGGGGGTLIVRASESVELSGISIGGVLPSGLVSASFSNAPAGDSIVETGRLTISNGAVVTASTIGPGDGGNVIIRADRIEVAGTGTSTNGLSRSSLSTSSGTEVFSIPSPGSAGDLQIFADELIVRDGAEVSVSSVDTGDSGTLNIDANSIELDNGGTIAAATNSGTGGNLTLNTSLLQLRDGSSITTNAGNTNGGNITIETDVLAALENSDITANASLGKGGQVTVSAIGIFGTEFRPTPTPQSDITATSNLGTEFNGIVTLRTPDVDPSTGLVELPANLTDPENRVVSQCGTTEGNSFTIVGHGGLPEDPTLALREMPSWSDARNWRELGQEGAASIPPPASPSATLIEATGWIRQGNGTIELVAEVPQFPKSPLLECHSHVR
ncbi:MAG: S-layer family protein [Cyanobacteriota bacterium]|nr:S-layer family protein [Cyanobacteriota bacterium]